MRLQNRRCIARVASAAVGFYATAVHAQAAPDCVGLGSPLRVAPVQVSAGPSGLGTLAEACPGSDLRLKVTGSALVSRDDFYGLLNAAVQLGFRYALSDQDWLSFSAPGLEYRFAANATVEASSLTLGAGALGYHRAFRVSQRHALSPWVRVLLPTESAGLRTRRYAIEHGVSVLGALSNHLTWLAGATFPLFVTSNGQARYYVFLPTYVGEVAFHPARPLSLVLGAALRLRAGEHAGFEGLEPRAAVRAHPGRGVHLELAAATPILGNDRTDLLAALTLYWAWGELR